MIYTKVTLKIDFEMNIPAQGAESVESLTAEMEKDGGPESFIKTMSDEVIKGLASPFTTAKVTDGSVKIVEV